MFHKRSTFLHIRYVPQTLHIFSYPLCSTNAPHIFISAMFHKRSTYFHIRYVPQTLHTYSYPLCSTSAPHIFISAMFHKRSTYFHIRYVPQTLHIFSYSHCSTNAPQSIAYTIIMIYCKPAPFHDCSIQCIIISICSWK